MIEMDRKTIEEQLDYYTRASRRKRISKADYEYHTTRAKYYARRLENLIVKEVADKLREGAGNAET